MFEFMCFRSSQEKLFYESYYSIETDALQNFVISLLVKLQYPYSATNSFSSIL